MKVYVIFDPLLKKVMCVHVMPNLICDCCSSLKETRIVDKLQEIEMEVREPNIRIYDSPAILGYYDNVPEINLKLETKTVQVEQRKLERIADADEENIQQEEPLYHNTKTGKIQKLFDVLNKVWTVRYVNHEVGDKGEALYITLEAENQIDAVEKAMKNKKFTKHIEMKYFSLKCLSAYEPKGNFVIGKVEYFEGDPRL